MSLDKTIKRIIEEETSDSLRYTYIIRRWPSDMKDRLKEKLSREDNYPCLFYKGGEDDYKIPKSGIRAESNFAKYYKNLDASFKQEIYTLMRNNIPAIKDKKDPEGVKFIYRQVGLFLIDNYTTILRHYKKQIKLNCPKLQESTTRTLKEETNYLRMLSRRLPDYDKEKMDKEFNSSLNYISKMFIKNYKSDPAKLSIHEFTRMVMVDFISIIQVRRYLPDDVEWYEDLVKGLSKHYQKRITSMYNVLKR